MPATSAIKSTGSRRHRRAVSAPSADTWRFLQRIRWAGLTTCLAALIISIIECVSKNFSMDSSVVFTNIAAGLIVVSIILILLHTAIASSPDIQHRVSVRLRQHEEGAHPERLFLEKVRRFSPLIRPGTSVTFALWDAISRVEVLSLGHRAYDYPRYRQMLSDAKTVGDWTALIEQCQPIFDEAEALTDIWQSSLGGCFMFSSKMCCEEEDLKELASVCGIDEKVESYYATIGEGR